MKYMIENDYIVGKLAFDEIAVSPNETSGYLPFELAQYEVKAIPVSRDFK